MKKIIAIILSCMLIVTMFGGCTKKQEETQKAPEKGAFIDGTYHAEYNRKDVRNWIPYVDITVKDGKITKAYYDYTNEKGDLRTKDENYTQGYSQAHNGTTPRQDFDKLGAQLVDTQDIEKVDVVSGATHSSRNFTELATAALRNAASGDTTKAKIPLYEDGTYRVEADAFDKNGWKPFVEVTIKDGNISAVTFDAQDKSGSLKTANAEYKTNMEAAVGTYPEKYSSELETQLIDKQVISQVDAISGATTSSAEFSALVEYALDEMAEVGDTQPGVIKLDEVK